MSGPYLSIVVAARNDNHGGDLLGRMQCFVTALLDQCRALEFPAELIVVEWNPPADRPRLIDALRWSESPCRVRMIEVPESLHRTYQHAAVLPLYQMIAKNAGIRRARGEFVLATNIDILFSNELMEFAARHGFEKGKLYRLDRLDVQPYPPIEASVEERLAFCASHVIRVNAREGAIALDPDGRYRLEDKDIAHGVRLVCGWHGCEWDRERAFRWASSEAEIRVPRDFVGMLALELEPGPGTGWRPFDLELEGAGTVRVTRRCIVRFPVSAGRVVLRVNGPEYLLRDDPRVLRYKVYSCALEDGAQAPPTVEVREGFRPALGRTLLGVRSAMNGELASERPSPHTTACGDFTLMAREHWDQLRGYAELDQYSLHIDSLLLWASHFLGLEELVLADPCRAYHIEHGTGSGWTPEGENPLFERLKTVGLPWMSFPELLEAIRQMRARKAPAMLNGPDWGLATHRLTETRVHSGTREVRVGSRREEESVTGRGDWKTVSAPLAFAPQTTALIVCDVWDRHWCPSAAARIAKLAKGIERLAATARSSGVLIVHAPFGTMNFYEDSQARRNIRAIPTQRPPASLALEDPPLPVDASDGGCDSPAGGVERDTHVWTRQHPAISIHDADLVSDDGGEIYGALRARDIDTLLYVGVHTNMCILDRPYGIRQMAKWGMNCVLVRDLTDAMYNPASRPFVTHAEGSELVIGHIERHWAPTLLSAGLEQALQK